MGIVHHPILSVQYSSVQCTVQCSTQELYVKQVGAAVQWFRLLLGCQFYPQLQVTECQLLIGEDCLDIYSCLHFVNLLLFRWGWWMKMKIGSAGLGAVMGVLVFVIFTFVYGKE